jgi:N-acetylglucosamine-6-phosphate deacetylase
MTSRLTIKGGMVITPQAAINNGIVLCEDGHISFVGSADEAAPEPNSPIVDATGCIVMPGLIDTHFHGSGGDDVMANGADGLARIAKSLLRFGTTGFLATTIAARHTDILRTIEDVKAAEGAPPNKTAQLLGIHLEGPYINLKYKGAQPVEGIRDPNFDECTELLAAAEDRIKIMTLAPELPGGLELIRWLRQRGVQVSLGHSESDYDTVLAAIEAGATRATHLFNAMSGLHHRKPGLAAAALNEPGICAELICDGVHLHPQVVRHAWRNKGRDGITLVTDAMAAQGAGDGEYTLGSFQVKVRGNLCTLLDDTTIAGSVLTMDKALANAHAFAGMDWIDLAHTAAYLPAQACGASDRKGSLEIGKDADLAIFKPDFVVTHTVIAGQVAYAT